jgi:hypothetical protein
MKYALITTCCAALTCQADVLQLTTGTEVPCTVTSYSNMYFSVVNTEGKTVRHISGSIKRATFEERARTITIETRNGPVAGKLLRYENGQFHLEDDKGRSQTVAAILVRSFRLPPPGNDEPAEDCAALDLPGTVARNDEIALADLVAPGKVTIVFFYGSVGQPGVQCKLLNNYLDNVLGKDQRLAVRKVDIGGWDSPVAQQYKVTAIPRLDLYDSTGKLFQSIIGNRQPELMTALKRIR